MKRAKNGLISLGTMVGLIYGYTIYKMKQEDFGDVLVPDEYLDKEYEEKFAKENNENNEKNSEE